MAFFFTSKKKWRQYGKQLMDTAIKTGIDAAKTASKRIVQETAKATGDLIGNKIADKFTLVVKTQSKENENETNKRQSIYIRPKKFSELLKT